MKKALVIIGPTATGKSELAVRLAKKFGGEIISADSRQVYKGLNIGTGKITRKEMRGVPHFLLDVADPTRKFTVSRYKKLAEQALKDISKRGKVPIIVGGTGFYVQALVDGIVLPEVKPDTALRKNLEKKTADELARALKKLDPERFGSIDVKNKRRLIRAIEIAQHTGKVPAISHKPLPYQFLQIGLSVDRKSLKKKIYERLLSRMKKGMVAEAKRLHSRGLSWRRMEELGLEYRFLAYYLQGKMSKEEMVEKLETAISQYAKRQMQWFKRDARIKWYKPSEQSKIEKEAKKFLDS